jgi:hypothetical protein
MTPWGSPQALAAQLRQDQHPPEDADKPSDDPLPTKKKSNPRRTSGGLGGGGLGFRILSRILLSFRY